MERKLHLAIVVTAALCLMTASMVMKLGGRSYGNVLGAAESRPNSIWIDTSNLNVSASRLGQEFNVTVWAEDITNVAAWQVNMFYNDTVINVTDWFEPIGDAQYIFAGKTTNIIPPPPEDAYHQEEPGNASVTVAALLVPVPPEQTPVTGTGKLGIIQFEVNVLPAENEQIVSPLIINTNDTYLLDQNGADVQGVTKYDASVTLTLGNPPFTLLGLELWVWAVIVIIIVLVTAVAVVLVRRTRAPATKAQAKSKTTP